MAGAQVPYSWAGRQVAVELISWGHGSRGSVLPLHGDDYIGTLELVNELGIMAILRLSEDGEVDEPTSKFYPWSSVISLRPLK